MLSNEINISPELIQEMYDELKPTVSKKVFFDMLVRERVTQIKDLEVNKFNQEVDCLTQMVSSDECELEELSRVIKKLSKLTHSLCKSQIRLFKVLNKHDSRDNKSRKNHY